MEKQPEIYPNKQHEPVNGHEHGLALQKRLDAIAQKDYALADQIRENLAREGVEVYDVKHPKTGERFTFYKDHAVLQAFDGGVALGPAPLTIFPHKVSEEDFALLMQEYKAQQKKRKK